MITKKNSKKTNVAQLKEDLILEKFKRLDEANKKIEKVNNEMQEAIQPYKIKQEKLVEEKEEIEKEILELREQINSKPVEFEDDENKYLIKITNKATISSTKYDDLIKKLKKPKLFFSISHSISVKQRKLNEVLDNGPRNKEEQIFLDIFNSDWTKINTKFDFKITKLK